MKKPVAIWTRYDDNSIDFCQVHHRKWRSKYRKLFMRQLLRPVHAFFRWLWRK